MQATRAQHAAITHGIDTDVQICITFRRSLKESAEDTLNMSR